jgi:outer membrane murein-binding lipoprotein Lpp
VPESWKPEMRGHWPKVSPEVQQYWHEREAQMRAGVEPLIPKVQLADAINQAAAPYMARIQSLNLDLPRAVAGLMKVDHDLTTLPFEQKVQLLVRTAAGYGVDLTGQAQAAVQTYNPMVEQLQNKVAQLEGRYHTFEEQQKAAQDAAAQSQIQQFSKTAEHFEAVKPLMAKLLQGFMADDLQSAYDMAVRLSPDIFDKLQASKQAAADAEKRKAADEAAKRARAHAVSIKGSTPGVAKTDGPKDRRSVLREAFDNLSERL